MYEVMSDESGLHFFPLDDDDYRNAPPRPRHERPRRPNRRPRRPIVMHAPTPSPYPPYVPMPPSPVAYPPMPHPGYGRPAPQGPTVGGLDLRTGLKALGMLLPGVGQLVSAFGSMPDRPMLTGTPERDIARLVEYVADSFERRQAGAQTTGVLATAGAVLNILAEL